MRASFLTWIGLALELLAIYEIVTSGRDVVAILLLVTSALVFGVAFFRAVVIEERKNAERLSDVARLWKDGER